MSTFLGDDDSVQCIVVVNDKKQYSIWPDKKALPSGWSEEGYKGTRKHCLEYISTIWPDPTNLI